MEQERTIVGHRDVNENERLVEEQRKEIKSGQEKKTLSTEREVR